MDWKIVVGTFGLVFLAELGDKTQLTALAFSAGSKSTWSVFTGASLALILSTLVAVLIGAALNQQSVVPLEAIKIVAGVLFLIFGVLTLREGVFGMKKQDKTTVGEAPSAAGILTRAALESASRFESATAERYLAAAERTGNAAARDLLQRVAAEEAEHLKRIEHLVENQPQSSAAPDAPAPTERPSPPVMAEPDEDKSTESLLREFILTERGTASFYDKLASSSRLPQLKFAFAKLAEEERGHETALAKLLETIPS